MFQEVKLSKTVSTFAKEMLEQLPADACQPGALIAFNSQVDTLLKMTELCRSGFQQQQQNKKARLANYNRSLHFYSEKIAENKGKLQLTLGYELLADSIVGQESYPLLAQQTAASVFTSPFLEQVRYSILNHDTTRFQLIRLQIEEEIRLRLLEQKDTLDGTKAEVKEGCLHLLVGFIGLELTLVKYSATEDYSWTVRRLYNLQQANPKFQLVLDESTVSPLLLPSYREMNTSIDPHLRVQILGHIRQQVVNLNDLMKMNPERKERIESHYLAFVVFCLAELNVWFILARSGFKIEADEDSTVCLALPQNCRVRWSMPKTIDILNNEYVPTANINIDGQGFVVRLFILPGEAVNLSKIIYRIGEREIQGNIKPSRQQEPVRFTPELVDNVLETAKILKEGVEQIRSSNILEIEQQGVEVKWYLFIRLENGLLYCDNADLGAIALKSINNIRRSRLFGVVYQWSKETITVVYNPERRNYQFVSDVGHFPSFLGLKGSRQIVHQIMVYSAVLQHYSLAKIKYPSFKVKLRDIEIDTVNGTVSCVFNCQKRGIEFQCRGVFKDSVETYGDVEFRMISKERNDRIEMLERLKLKPTSPMDLTLFCQRLMQSFVFLQEIEEAETRPNLRLRLFEPE